MPAIIKWSAHSESGSRKPTNDDAWLVFSAGSKKSTRLQAQGEHSLTDDDLVLAVSDGMGGGNAGDLASRLLLSQLSQIIPQTIKQEALGFHPDYLEQLENAIQEIHLTINQQAGADLSLKGMAATITLLWFTPENAYIAHVGDSRLYLHRDKQTKMISDDHNYTWRKFNKGELSEREYRAHPKRSVLFEVVGGGHRKVTPSVLAIPYQLGDRFMLCSDGIVDGLSEKRIDRQLSRNADSTKDILDSLMSSAIDNAGTDDTTCIVFEVTN